MKKAITTIFGWFCICIAIASISMVASGERRYENACQYMEQNQNIVQTDQDITDVLKIYGFDDLDFMDAPDSWDYIKSNF